MDQCDPVCHGIHNVLHDLKYAQIVSSPGADRQRGLERRSKVALDFAVLINIRIDHASIDRTEATDGDGVWKEEEGEMYDKV